MGKADKAEAQKHIDECKGLLASQPSQPPVAPPAPVVASQPLPTVPAAAPMVVQQPIPGSAMAWAPPASPPARFSIISAFAEVPLARLRSRWYPRSRPARLARF